MHATYSRNEPNRKCWLERKVPSIFDFDSWQRRTVVSRQQNSMSNSIDLLSKYERWKLFLLSVQQSKDDLSKRKRFCRHVKQGVCCGNNGSVCCPNKYVCDAAQLSCQLEGDDLRTRRTILLSSEDFYQCGMSDVACTRDQTCCPTYGTSDDQYACCAFANVSDTREKSFLVGRSNRFDFRRVAVKTVDIVVHRTAFVMFNRVVAFKSTDVRPSTIRSNEEKTELLSFIFNRRKTKQKRKTR